MVLYLDQIERLLQHRSREHPVVSVYLNVTPPRNVISELNSLLHTTGKRLEQSGHFTRPQLRELEKLFERIEAHVRENRERFENTRLLVLFASAEGLWQEYRLPLALPSRVVVEFDPYTRPLTVLLDEFEHYAVLVTDARKARLFSLYLGDFEEHPDVFVVDDTPTRPRVSVSLTRSRGSGVWGGLADTRIQRHVEDHVHRHLKRVADQTFQLFQRKKFDLLILGAPEDKILPWLKDHLHSYLQERLAGKFHARPDWNEARLKEEALKVAQRWERQHEERLIRRLLELHGHKDKGVVGLEPTLNALMLGQVHTLVVQHDFRAKGAACPNDHHLALEPGPCPLCGAELEPVDDLIDEMVEEAIAQNAEIEHVFTRHEGFSEHGVGAILRFTL